MKKNIISTAVKIAVSGGLLYYLIGSMDVDNLLTIASTADVSFIIAMFVLLIAVQGLAVYRWGLVLKKDVDISYKVVTSLTFIGLFFNNFLPTIVGGDAVKAYYLYGHRPLDTEKGKRVTLPTILASILMDRYSGFTALMSIAFVALVLGYPLISGTGAVVASLAIISFYFIFSLFMWVEWLHSWLVTLLLKIGFYGLNEKIEKFYKALMGYKKDKVLIIKICFVSIFIQVGVILSFAAMGYSLGINISLWYYFLFIPVTTVVVMLPLSVSGIGVREGIMVLMFSFGGVESEPVVVMSLMWFAGLTLVSMIGGVEYARLGGSKEFSESGN